MAAVPIYVWNGTAWQETGPVIPASPIKYQASAPSSPSTGDIWVDSDGDVTTGSQQFQRFRFVASGGETSISGVDANGATLAYTAGTEIVALNGSTLVRGQDYTATNGTSITGLSPALVANDVVEVFSFMAFNVANTYTQSQADGLFQTKAANGLVLLNTTSFSAVSSVSLAANSFSTTYDRYLIKLLYKVNSTAGSLRLKFRSSGSDLSTGYYYSGNYARSSNTSGVTYGSNDAAYYSTNADSKADSAPNMMEIELLNPLSTERKQIFTRVSHWASGDFQESINVNGFCSNTSTADSFTMYITGAGTITGSYQLYGFNK